MKVCQYAFLALALFPRPFVASSLLGTEITRVAISTSQDTSWWAGIIDHGFQMPLPNGYEADFFGNTYGNQGQPLLLSSHGDVIWSDEPFAFQLSQDSLSLETRGEPPQRSQHGRSLRDAFLYASKTYFPPSGKTPSESLFLAPQYNTWIELMYNQNQIDVLKYARGIEEHDFPPGVIMIDDNWQENYGQWDFKNEKFPDPKGMIDRLHEHGFKVMLWICPFVNTNCDCFTALAKKSCFLKDSSGAVALIKWWNGNSALLDLSSPGARDWFCSRLDYLQSTYGVDGFKFDAGDSSFYKDVFGCKDISPNTQSELYGRIGLQYPLNEYRAMWKMGGQPLAERLRDKEHTWSDLKKLVPNMLLEGLMGYPFSCPDMIGGGEYKSFQSGTTVDQELVVRSAQCHALMPMMQFSVAPWRVLDSPHLKAVLDAVKVRQSHKAYILELAHQSADTGEPIVRSMEYVCPHQGYDSVNDQFFLGDRILVAPILEQGAIKRKIVLPQGAWKGFDGKQYEGPIKVTLSVNDNDLCYFERVAQ